MKVERKTTVNNETFVIYNQKVDGYKQYLVAVEFNEESSESWLYVSFKAAEKHYLSLVKKARKAEEKEVANVPI